MINLDEGSFIQLLRKPETEMWVVDYFASWCGPCQKLAIHWRKMAKQVVIYTGGIGRDRAFYLTCKYFMNFEYLAI